MTAATAQRPARPHVPVSVNFDLDLPAGPEPKREVDADGYERGARDYCELESIRLYRGRVAGHWEMRWWRKVVDHHYRRALVPTTERCAGSGEPPARRWGAES